MTNSFFTTMISRLRLIILFLFFAFLPTQLGTFFFVPYTFLSGIRIDYLAPALYFTDILALLLILLHLPSLLILRRQRRLWWIGLIVLASAIMSLNISVGGYRLLKALEALFVGVVVFQYARTNMALLTRIAVPAFLAGAIFELVLVVLQLIQKGSIQGVFYWFGERAMTLSTPDVARASLAGKLFLRPYGTFSHPNSLAGFYLLVYVFFLTWPQAKRYIRMRGALLAICMLLILFSFSKTAIITFATLNLLIFMNVLIKGKCKICGISRVLTLVVLAWIFSSSQGDPLSIEKRLWLVDSAFQIISSNALLGVGPGNYLIAQHEFPIPYATFFLQPVHNIVVLFIAELGVVGGGAIIALLYKPFVWLVQQRMFRYCFAVVLITGMMDHHWLTLQQNILLVPAVFGIIIGLACSSLRNGDPSKSFAMYQNNSVN